MNKSDTYSPSLESLRVCDRLLFEGGRKPIEFIGRSNLWIDNFDEREAVYAARVIISQALEGTCPGQLSIIGYDSDLSGVFAPFSGLSSGDVRQLTLVDGLDELKEQLKRIRLQIQSVQNVIQGRCESLVEFRRMIGRPIECYYLVVLFLDMGMASRSLQSEISLLMKSGPAAGITFLVVSTTSISMGFESDGDGNMNIGVEDVFPNVEVVEPDGGGILLEDGSRHVLPRCRPDHFLGVAERFAARFHKASLPTVRYDEIQRIGADWTEKSIDGLTFAIGKYGLNNVEITLGDEVGQRHNALVTGAVGQGKSNLISIIVHSLCQRYSPDELRLYLLDFKEGVTFKPFAGIGKEDYLPHAAALGLECDVAFGVATLEYLHKEYRRRMRLMKDAGVRNLRELRIADPQARLPRVVVIIDEFQLMFGDDPQAGQRVADLLERAVRLFRAAGIHFILSSQTLGGNVSLSQNADALFSQVPIRIALKNSEVESRKTLGLNNAAAAYLRPREAVVNLDYGEVSQNRRTVIAFADERLLEPMRVEWWERARRRFGPPLVFESERLAGLGRCAGEIAGLRRRGRTPRAFLGERVSIEGQKVEIPLGPEPGRNIAIIGTPSRRANDAVGIAQSAMVSLAYQHPLGDANFYACDFTSPEPHTEANVAFASAMERAGYFVEDVPQDGLSGLLGELLNNELCEPAYIMALGLDRWPFEPDPYAQGSPLKALAEKGPSRGVHLIGWWTKASSFTSQVAGYGNSDSFNTKVFLRVDERSVQTLTSPFVRWSSSENRMLVFDPIEYADSFVAIPFSPLGESDLDSFRAVTW